MRHYFSFIVLLLIAMPIRAELRSKPAEQVVVLSSGVRHRLVEATNPSSTFLQPSNVLTINVNPEHYSSYTIRLTPGNGGTDIVVAATSATVSIPVVDVTTDYVVTVDGGDYGTYDGLFSPSNGSTITLNDMQAMQLIKNRRESNEGINIYSATVNSLINDPYYCRIDTLPNDDWATDSCAKKLVLVDEYPDFGLGHKYSYYYLPSQLTVESVNVYK